MNFNEDPVVDWEEFTTFCIQTDVEESKGSANEKLDTYVIAYVEDKNMRDQSLSSYAPLSVMKYIPDGKRVMVVQDKGGKMILFDDKFQRISTLDPSEIPLAADPLEKVHIHDCCYLPSKDLYAYCASDHTIVACKEHAAGKTVRYAVQRKIYSSDLHLKLCWSDGSKILCSVSADHMIFGWDIEGDSQMPIFHLSRHTDMITDFIALDHLDLFITCSLDKRVVMWSQTTRRVRGVIVGHKRGVRSMSYARDFLLTAGFECEAKLWEMQNKELQLILRGHRHPVQTARLMCPTTQAGLDLRAVTVDDSGEFRLWNCNLRDKNSTSNLAEVLQVFSMSITDGGASQIAQVRFIDLPYDPSASVGTYSNIIAGSPGLIHIIPEKTLAEFHPPSSMCVAEPSGFVITSCGKMLTKYDLCGGAFQKSISKLEDSDISCSCLDGYYGRRVFVGFANGRIVLLNFTTGAVISSMMANPRGVSCITVVKEDGRCLVYVGSPDGRITCIEESLGRMSIHLTAEHVIGDNCGLSVIASAPTIGALAAASGGRMWGIW
jgi:WD40 repeat protein